MINIFHFVLDAIAPTMEHSWHPPRRGMDKVKMQNGSALNISVRPRAAPSSSIDVSRAGTRVTSISTVTMTPAAAATTGLGGPASVDASFPPNKVALMVTIIVSIVIILLILWATWRYHFGRNKAKELRRPKKLRVQAELAQRGGDPV